ncbi:two-component sensor histidine kinase [Leminorella grimontii]|uniref:Sensor protein QseC n=1 Tax=Leminorella grimontii TaxID=82981 RepID=A0AAV5N0P5_9GAMM|nr:quorum sensing histidine kinase QseC [Leminorella grimontii]KFC96197.1 sensory histidine kinase [Leminorella grimontii ATCC 33999 = DSM 5078]GKX54614.1 two-component sensor histidine kinase [Leminorella grimontii]GKX58032.1 two-component sensor histidine kinase [Leminorella grimontii]VFS58814.1 Sensor protein qseC [Leminorella grimontii]
MKFNSLRLRLTLLFSLVALLAWASASLMAWWQINNSVNELFDTQQMLFAKRLTVLNPQSFSEPQSLQEMKKTVRHNRGKLDDDALAFAIFTLDGQRVLSDGDNGKRLIFDYRTDGFADGGLVDDDDPWRVIWLMAHDKKHIVAVGQEWEYREDMARDIILSQLAPWLIALPMMILLLIGLITYELRPLTRIVNQLNQRRPDDDAALVVQRVPSEVKPMVDALNRLFSRIGQMLTRERRFTSDAAHELRSPLAALKVQAEVVQLAGDDDDMRNAAVVNLMDGIDRSSRVVDQLLTLSRLDSLSQLSDVQEIEWPLLLQTAIADHYQKARAKDIELSLSVEQTPKPISGQPLLLSILLRNLLDNAMRYSPPGSTVAVTLTSTGFRIEDNGPGVNSDFLARIGERFFRPPGQEKSGSGLGLSIVERIARLHGLGVSFRNRPQGGFVAELNINID